MVELDVLLPYVASWNGYADVQLQHGLALTTFEKEVFGMSPFAGL